MKKYLLGAALSLLCTCIYAQNQKPVSVYLSGGFSANAYKGDLSNSYNRWTPAFHLGLQTHRRRWTSACLELNAGTLTGQSSDLLQTGQRYNDFFTTSFFSASVSLRFQIIKNKNWQFYLGQGVGLMSFTPRDKNGKKLEDQPATRESGEFYSTTALLLPGSVGFSYLFSNGYGWGMEAGWLNPQSDYLDNISQLGRSSKNDRMLRVKLSVFVPLLFEKEKGTDTKEQAQ